MKLEGKVTIYADDEIYDVRYDVDYYMSVYGWKPEYCYIV